MDLLNDFVKRTFIDLADPDATPVSMPSLLVLENGLRQCVTGSDEHVALLKAGYSEVERDDQRTILRRARRATDARIANGDVERFRRVERQTLDALAAELTKAGHPIEAGQLRWAMDEFRQRVMRATGIGRTVVSGSLR